MQIEAGRSLRTSFLLVLFLPTMACPQKSAEEATTADRLRMATIAILNYRDFASRLPSALRDVCVPIARSCSPEGSLASLVDGWGSPLQFRAPGGTVVSAGRDRLFSSPDDVSIDALDFERRARALTGCFKLDHAIRDLGSSDLRLDSIRLRVGGYDIARPRNVKGDSAYIAMWYPASGDSIEMSWIHIDTGLELRGAIRGDSLFINDRGATVSGIRTTCSDR